MSDPDSEVQKLIFEALLADAAIAVLVGTRIYDRMPSDGQYPCICFGPSDTVPDDVQGLVADEITIQLDIWSQDNGRLHPCKAITGAVKSALHYAPLSLPAPYALVQIWVHSIRMMLDADGATAHGIVTVIAQVETH